MKRLLLPLLLLAASPALAQGRSEQFTYSPSKVFQVTGQQSIQTLIQFAEDEAIENIALGDAGAWQVTPNKRANMLFIKPLAARGKTNMTVVTNRRRYLFDLAIAGPKGHVSYAIQFVYPEDEMAAALMAKRTDNIPGTDVVPQPAPPPPPVNTSWQMKGDKVLQPARIYDDGEATFIAWSPSVELPGIFAFSEDGKEGPVNFTVRGDYLVIDGVAPRYILRRGKANLTLTNLAPRAPKPVAARATEPTEDMP